jgi:hypothetical protein
MNDDFTNVHAMAYKTDGDYQIKLINTPPTNHDEFAKVLELIDEGRQLVLWVPEGTPGDTAQNLATHFVATLRVH